MLKKSPASAFGERLRKLRKGRRLTLEAVARKVGTKKGYLSEIENGKVKPPSIRLVQKLARLFEQDPCALLRLAWLDRAPELLRNDARRRRALADMEDGVDGSLVPVPILNPEGQCYPCDFVSGNGVKAEWHATLVLPRGPEQPDAAVMVCDASLASGDRRGFREGDVALLRRSECLQNGTLAFVVFSVRGARQALLREIFIENDRTVILRPLNRTFPLEFTRTENLVSVHTVCGRIESFRP